MKRISMVLFAITLFTACGGGLDGKKLADETCHCSAKANAMDIADPKRTEAQNACNTKNMESWTKVKDNKKQSDIFNKRISECVSQQIRNAFGQ